jgi:3-dehydroquinate synthase
MNKEHCSTVKVLLDDRSYDIRIGTGLVPGESIREEVTGRRALIVTDSNVEEFYGADFESRIESMGAQVSRTVVPAGESTKDLDFARTLYSEAVRAGLDRSSLVFALGGGVVGDLAGFVAATYLRGIRYVQVPTTTVSMLDSSVGGKTGLNLEEGKNLVGAFYQPEEVTIDLATLRTLPEREYVSGLAELIKHAVIWDADLFEKLENGADRLAGRETVFLQDVITRSCEIKAAVVAMDEKEMGVRAALNFGHTLAHALEKVAGYGSYLHGEAVSVGMVYAAELSVLDQGLDRKDADRIRNLLARINLPVSPVRGGRRTDWQDIRKAMTRDKKARASVPRFSLVERLGSIRVGCIVDENVLESVYAGL